MCWSTELNEQKLYCTTVQIKNDSSSDSVVFEEGKNLISLLQLWEHSMHMI